MINLLTVQRAKRLVIEIGNVDVKLNKLFAEKDVLIADLEEAVTAMEKEMEINNV